MGLVRNWSWSAILPAPISTIKQDNACRAAVKPAPFEPFQDAGLGLGAAQHLFQLAQLLRRYLGFQLEPVLAHILRYDVHNLADNPVIAVETVQRCIVLGQPGQRIAGGFQQQMGQALRRRGRHYPA